MVRIGKITFWWGKVTINYDILRDDRIVKNGCHAGEILTLVTFVDD